MKIDVSILEDRPNEIKVLGEMTEKKLANIKIETQTLRHDNENLEVEKMQAEDLISQLISENNSLLFSIDDAIQRACPRCRKTATAPKNTTIQW